MSGLVDHFDLPDLDRQHTALHNPVTPSPATSTAEDAGNHTAAKGSHRFSELPVLATMNSEETSAVKAILTSQHMAELTSLREQNKLLVAEVQRLTALLREKERSEQELKRRILESEAEAKSWRKQYEMLNTSSIEIRDNDGIDLSADLIDQLDSAAEKLSRFNAVKDLKLLQSEMEIALNEIREK
ncbi:unnamed protein product [Toxocara canis]|uniref:GOLGA2L5 domain-containing protein n=1 Tax=Toxocara canis TaxID=6265 RepID=A0A183V5T3_TOXCA|nr:unnamed protein product [Toxocara canis]